MSAYLIVILVLVVLLAFSGIFSVLMFKLYKETKDRLNRKTEAYNGLMEEFETYRKAEEFKHKKEEETNEKINEVLTGDSVSNAINILCKHKNN